MHLTRNIDHISWHYGVMNINKDRLITDKRRDAMSYSATRENKITWQPGGSANLYNDSRSRQETDGLITLGLGNMP